MLYIIAGASGCGKKFVLERMKRLRVCLFDISKMTDKMAPSDSALKKKDLDYGYSYDEIYDKCGDYVYQYEGNWYGIDVSKIDNALIEGKSPIVIVRDYETIYKLKQRYPLAILIYIHTALTGDALKDRLTELGIKDDMSVVDRLNREKKDYNNMIQQIDKYQLHFDGYIANNFDSTIDLQIQNILLSVQEVDYHRIFVAMPFTESQDYVPQFVEEAIDSVERLLNNYLRSNISTKKTFKVYRVDKSEKGYFATYSIQDRLNSQIKEANMMICDLSMNNPNVSYEYEEAIFNKKQVITIARDGSFGATHHKDEINIIYSPTNPAELINKLFARVCELYKIYPTFD